jgi:prenyltransferase beta subunit
MNMLRRCLPVVLLLPGAAGQALLRPPGVSAATEDAIGRGISWLAQHQASDGSWRNASGFGSYPVAMTGLAGMALLGGGSTATRGRHWRQVRAATDFLISQANPNGVIGAPAAEGHTMFGHGFATLFLASVFGMEEDTHKQARLQRVLDHAVTLIAKAQSSAGGWYYTPDAADDEGSVTVTQVQALRACRMAGIVVDKRTIDRAVDYIRKCQNSDGGIRYRLGASGESRPAITAAGIAVLWNAGIYDDAPFVDNAFRYCQRHVQVTVDTTGHHFYMHLYWSQALWQRGGEVWSSYYEQLAAWLLRQQQPEGSWDGDGVGTIYGTAIALTALQLPYALVPIWQR